MDVKYIFLRGRFIMKFVMKAEREGAYGRRVSQGISSEIWPRNATQQIPLRSLLEKKFIMKRSLWTRFRNNCIHPEPGFP
jgi:hypothetical protein